jgi:hypothetical protein
MAMNTGSLIEMLAEQLDDFDPAKRAEALKPFVGFLVQGELKLSPPSDNANLHIHSFFSYNADGHSPTRIAWEARRAGLFGAGIVEFDVLDGIEEFLSAGNAFGLRTTVGVESRVFIEDYADKEINSPGEPGISYHMGAGFVKLPPAGSPADAVLQKMRAFARRRNEQMAERVNAYLGEAAVDYEKDIVPLTPSGNATERHMLAAYEAKAKAAFPDFAERAAYWASKLGEDAEAMKEVMCHVPQLHELMRSRLMKRGGVGYVPPEKGNFPTLDEMNEMTVACGALPCPTWLDGTSAGEADPVELVTYHVQRGALAINIIPDRNWNIADPQLKARKADNLYAIVKAADDAGLVIIHGTERNRSGLPFVDDLSCEALKPIAESLRRGAYAVFGHTAMARFADRPLGGEWARSAFGSDATARGAFYANVGRLLEPGEGAAERLRSACTSDDPGAITATLSGS